MMLAALSGCVVALLFVMVALFSITLEYGKVKQLAIDEKKRADGLEFEYTLYRKLNEWGRDERIIEHMSHERVCD